MTQYHPTDPLPATPLPERIRRSFNDNGYVVIPGVLPQDLVRRLVAEGDYAMTHAKEADLETKPGGWASLRNCISYGAAFRELLTAPLTASYAIQLLGPNVHLMSSQLIYLAPAAAGDGQPVGEDRRQFWHRDTYRTSQDLGPKLCRIGLKCGYYMTDALHYTSGTTKFMPGSHLENVPPEFSPGSADPVGTIEPELKAGDCVMFENRILHAGGYNTSRVTRKCVMLGYGFRWVKPLDYAVQSPDLMARFGPIGRFLLGAQQAKDRDAVLGTNPLSEWFEQLDYRYVPFDK